ncbi:MAG: hypothetical protein PHU25_10700, partial [Deltaproteobacteria bacterium]|nr:hypothetical protein [Deltaproteobacteria bacterium]
PVAGFLRSRGLTEEELSLLGEYCASFEREKEIARRLGKTTGAVWTAFSRIRAKLGARNQADLKRILGVLSRFDRREAAQADGKDNRLSTSVPWGSGGFNRPQGSGHERKGVGR